MKKLILAIVMLGVTTALVGGHATSASYADRVSRTGNTFTTATMTPPSAAPTACLASAASLTCSGATTTDGSTVKVFWTATGVTAGATGYNIYRSASSAGALTLIGSSAGLSYTDLNPRDQLTAPCTACYYKVTSRYITGGANWESQTKSPESGAVRPLDHFALSVAAGNKTSGTAFTLTLTAQDTANGTVTGYVGAASLSVPAGSSISPATTAAFSAGGRTESVTVTTSTSPVVITGTGGAPVRSGSVSLTFSITNSLTIHSDQTMTKAAKTAGSKNLTQGTTLTWTATNADVTSASNSTNWTLILDQGARPTTSGVTATVNIWWQATACSTPVAGQIFATGSVAVPAATSGLGISLAVPNSAGTVNKTLGATDRLCLSIMNTSAAGTSREIDFFTDTNTTSGVTGVSRLDGPN